MVPARPRLHATQPQGWLNDPHGVVCRDGTWHLFHQSVPDQLLWAPEIEWGHLTSPDLVHWSAQPPVLRPGDGDDGVWTGSVVAGPTGPVAFYTSVRAPDLHLGRIRTATPVDPGLAHWEKGPVVVEPRVEDGVTSFRDPFVCRDGDGWLMVVGAGLAGGRPAVLGYRSDDLAHWTPVGPLVTGPAGSDRFGAVWECPQLVRVGEHRVLVVSPCTPELGLDVLAGVVSSTGTGLVVERWTAVTAGGAHYAPTAFVDADDAPCLLFWLRGAGSADEGWAGALSIPYRLSLRDGAVALEPHPAVRSAVADLGAQHGNGVLGLDWWPRDGDLLTLTDESTGAEIARLSAGAAHILVDAVGRQVEVARAQGQNDAVMVLVDGCVLEVTTRACVAGLPVPPAATMAVTATTMATVSSWAQPMLALEH